MFTKGRVCKHCRYYESPGKVVSRCGLDSQMTVSGETTCECFTDRSPIRLIIVPYGEFFEGRGVRVTAYEGLLPYLMDEGVRVMFVGEGDREIVEVFQRSVPCQVINGVGGEGRVRFPEVGSWGELLKMSGVDVEGDRVGVYAGSEEDVWFAEANGLRII